MGNPFFEIKKKPDKAKTKVDLTSIGIPTTGPMADMKRIPTPMYTMETDSSEIQQTVKQLKEELRSGEYSKYAVFVATKNAMAALPTDELKYTSAFAALSIGGLTKDVLISTAKLCHDKISKEGKDFEVGYQAAYEEQVGKNSKIMQVKIAELNDLSAKMNLLNQQIADLKSKSEDAEVRLLAKKQSFQRAVVIVGSEIESEISNINNYIK